MFKVAKVCVSSVALYSINKNFAKRIDQIIFQMQQIEGKEKYKELERILKKELR